MFIDNQINILNIFLKNHVTMKTGAMAAENLFQYIAFT